MLSLALVATGLLVVAAEVAGQGVRGWTGTRIHYVDVRPIVIDSIPRDAVTRLPDGSFEFEGRTVYCSGVDCVRYQPAPREHVVLASVDASVTAWGLGTPGLSVRVHLRGRDRLDGAFAWPRSDDRFDALLGYAELQRDAYRVRVGRQTASGGLGFAGYDGASLVVRPLPALRLEAFGGRSLARGLNEPRNEALRGIERLLIDQGARLVGAAVDVEPRDGTTVGLRYQREIWADRSALLTERASLDARSTLPGMVGVDASLDYDFAFGRVGKAHLNARRSFAGGRVWTEATVRRYLPYFELWTIWGYFSPVPYHEAEVRAGWSFMEGSMVWASGGWRQYGEHDAPVIFRPLEDDATRVGLGGSFRLSEVVTLQGAYRLESGPGAYLSNGDASLSWSPMEGVRIGAHGTAFQQIEEFRLGDTSAFGGGLDFDLELRPGLMLAGGASVYRNLFDNRPAEADWTQRRGWISLSAEIGGDPGLAGAGGGR